MDGPRPSRWHVAQARDDGTGYWEVDPGLYARAVSDARQSACRRIYQGHAEALSALRDRYPQTEREGWHELVADAKDGGGECIEDYAAELGVSVEDAVSRVLSARQGYRKGYGYATGKLTKLRDQIDAAETVEELDSTSWELNGD